VPYRGRVRNDVLAWRPDVVVVTGGRNDSGFSAVRERAEATALFRQIRAALPHVVLIVTSAFPASQAEARNARLLALSEAIRAGSVGLADHYLDVMGNHAYITGNGDAGAPSGSGNADVLTSADGVHPTQAGHDELARQLFLRLRARPVP
jgi:lysophospholipase L1-like esterase